MIELHGFDNLADMIRVSIRFPSKEELFESAQSHLAVATPTYLENWPIGLQRLTMAQSGRPLSEKEVESLMSFQSPEDCVCDQETLNHLLAWIETQLAFYPQGVYVKLGSRSPKDSYLSFDPDGFKVRSGGKAITLLGDSCRVFEDLVLAKNGGYQPWLFLREWKEIPAWAEFRCFMKDRKLTGISQYYYREAYPEVEKYAGTIEWGIGRFFENYFLPEIHVDDVVFDVWVSIRDRHSSNQIEVKLLEINPYSPMTDPCLCSWADPNTFDGKLRFKREGDLKGQDQE